MASGACSTRLDQARLPDPSERVHGRPLVWLDNAATTQKPQAVIDRLSYFYEHENSNIHRAAHTLAARATDAYEGARDKVRRFLNAPSAQEIVFVRGATEAINLVAQSWGRRNVEGRRRDRHHLARAPRQHRPLAAAVRREGRAPLRRAGRSTRPGHPRGVREAARAAHAAGLDHAGVERAGHDHARARDGRRWRTATAPVVLVDGAQAVSHMPVDVQALDCDFYCFSGHKVFAPTGIGALFGKATVLDAMPPWQGGGNMIRDVTFEKTTYQPPPWTFEAGTGNIADAVGLGAAIDYVSGVGLENIARYEHELLVYATERLLRVPGLTLDRHRGGEGGRPLVRPRRHPHGGCGRRAGQGRDRRTRRGTIAPSPFCDALVWKPRCGHRWRPTTPWTTSMPCARPCCGCRSAMSLRSRARCSNLFPQTGTVHTGAAPA